MPLYFFILKTKFKKEGLLILILKEEFIMSISSKLNTLKSFLSPLFNTTKNVISTTITDTGKAATFSKDVFINFIEKYKGIRRIILVIVLWINIHIFLVTSKMYQTLGQVDTQWIIYAGYWTAILGTFIGFYTVSRVKEFNSETDLAPKGEWIVDNNKEQKEIDKIKKVTSNMIEESFIEERIEIDGDSLIEGEMINGPQ